MPDQDHDRIGTKLRDLIRLMLTPDPFYRPDIHKILSIVENWNEFDQIPLSEDAYKIKSKQEAITSARNMSYKNMSDADLLGFNVDPPKPSVIKHGKKFKYFTHLL